eukprot:1350361-Prymnesium_polylepis.1
MKRGEEAQRQEEQQRSNRVAEEAKLAARHAEEAKKNELAARYEEEQRQLREATMQQELKRRELLKEQRTAKQLNNERRVRIREAELEAQRVLRCEKKKATRTTADALALKCKTDCLRVIDEERRTWQKECPMCKTLVMRLDNQNNHIRCKCCTSFCFLCGTVLKGMREMDTGKLHFNGKSRCPQHGNVSVSPTAQLLHKFIGKDKCTTENESVDAMTIATAEVDIPHFTAHAATRSTERNKSYATLQRVKKYGTEVETHDSHGNESLLIQFGNDKMWLNSRCTKTNSVA